MINYTQWYPEVHSVCPSAVISFVGNKIDLRDHTSHNNNFVPREEAAHAIKNLKCIYTECSALTRAGLVEVFENSVREVLRVKGYGQSKHKVSQVEDSCPGCQLI